MAMAAAAATMAGVRQAGRQTAAAAAAAAAAARGSLCAATPIRRRGMASAAAVAKKAAGDLPAKAADAGWSPLAKVGAVAAALAAPCLVGVNALRNDPELRVQVNADYPEAYAFLKQTVPGGIETITMEDLRTSDWPEDHELPWGEGYTEDLPEQTAVVTTRRGARFTVTLSATDAGQAIINKCARQGAALDDEVMDVSFVKEAGSDGYLEEAMQSTRAAQQEDLSTMSREQLQERLRRLRQMEHDMKVDRTVWEKMGASGVTKVQQATNELARLLQDKVQVKNQLKKLR